MNASKMKRVLKTFFFVFLFVPSFLAQGQTKVVTGTIYTLDGLSVGNVEITSKRTNSSVVSDPDGRFSIVCNEKDVLVFNGKVFEKRTIRIKKKETNLKVYLDFINTEENRELAVGYGYVSDRNKLNASEQAYNEDGFCNYGNMNDLMQVLFPTLTISSDCVIIRGSNSVLTSPCALIIIDGSRAPSYSYLSPCNVKSIDLLKDASATVYGAEGANGAIIINLK